MFFCRVAYPGSDSQRRGEPAGAYFRAGAAWLWAGGFRSLRARRQVLLASALVFFSTSLFAQDLRPVPPLTGRVVDLTRTLSAAQVRELEAISADYEAARGGQLLVLLVPGTQPESIEAYSLRVVEAWKPGRKNVDDGVLLLIAKDERALRIEVGYGLEGALPDARAKQIIEDVIVPYFKRGEFFEGIQLGLRTIVATIQNEPLPEPKGDVLSRYSLNDKVRAGLVAVGLLLLAVIYSWAVGGLIERLGGRGVAQAMGVVLFAIVGLVIAVYFTRSILALAVVQPAAFLVLLLNVMMRSNTSGGTGATSGGNQSSGSSSRTSSASSGSSSSSSRSSSSSGGGSFGGGGSSGRW